MSEYENQHQDQRQSSNEGEKELTEVSVLQLTNENIGNTDEDNKKGGTLSANADSKKPKSKGFSNIFTFFLSALGIWRFSRIVALNGGDNGAGGFLVVWLLFLFTWSIPIIIAEYAIGRKSKQSVVGTFHNLVGKPYTWMGVCILFINVAITCYYSVLTGWTFYYLGMSIFHPLPMDDKESTENWTNFENSYWPVLTHCIAVILAGLACIRGVRTIEKVNLILVPGMLLILFGCLLRSITLPGALKGLMHLFFPDFSILLKPETWLEALTQNAYDTGAGWALFLTYANHLSEKTSVTTIGTVTPIANNCISITAGITTFSTVFAMLGSSGLKNREILTVMRKAGPAGTGITFIWFPVLFGQVPLGKFICIAFFFALSFAALSSLIGLLHLPIKCVVDLGVKHWMASIIVTVFVLIMGMPSALFMSFLANQDHVWSGALVFCGGFFAFLILKYGPRKFRKEAVNMGGTNLRGWYDFIVCGLVPLQALALFVWWLVASVVNSSEETPWYNPVSTSSLMTCFIQWITALTFIVFGNIAYLVVLRFRNK